MLNETTVEFTTCMHCDTDTECQVIYKKGKVVDTICEGCWAELAGIPCKR